MKKSVFLFTLILVVFAIVGGWLFYNSKPTLTIANPNQQEETVATVPTPNLIVNTPKPSFKLTALNLKNSTIYQKSQIQTAISIFTPQKLTTFTNRISKHDLEFEYINEKGEVSFGVVSVYIPELSTKIPIIIFGSGTTGIADRCAPSLENSSIVNIGNYHNHALTQASQGQIFIFPDYDGYHDADKTHSYFVSESEAYTTIAAMLSVEKAINEKLINADADFEKIILSGYSQGGHTALATAEIINRLTPQFKVLGIVGYATARDPKALLLDQPELSPYLLYAYQNYYHEYEFKINEILLNNFSTNLKHSVLNHCIDTVYNFYPSKPDQIYQKKFAKALSENNLFDEFTSLDYFLSENTPTPKLNIPIVEFQGLSDTIVSPLSQQNNIKELCLLDNQVYYQELLGVDHFQIRQNSMIQTQEVLQKIYTNSFDANTCQ